MISKIVGLLVVWYYFIYRYAKERHKRRNQKFEITFWQSLNPKYWDDLW